jgi:hypothetical protein
MRGCTASRLFMLALPLCLCGTLALAQDAPLLKVLDQFTAADVPERGPQPIGLDNVLFVQNGLPPKAIVINKQTGAVEMERALPAPSPDNPKTVHPQFRRFRQTAAGTYLAAHLNMKKVAEYDKDFKEVWSYEILSPWSAMRLHNGNTLINDEKDRLVREVATRARPYGSSNSSSSCRASCRRTIRRLKDWRTGTQ